jgi:hypothetical protein
MFMKSLLSVAATGGLLLAAGAADAATYTTTSASAFATLGGNSSVGSVPDQVNWGLFASALGTLQNNGSIANNDMTATPGGDTVKVTSGDGNGFVTYVEGQGTAPTTSGRNQTAGTAWNGLFGAGTTILATSDGTITLHFSTPLIGLGIDAQIFNAGAYSETLTAYNASNQLLTSVSNTGVSTGATSGNKGKEGTAPFVGISTDAKNNAASLATAGISYITIAASCTANTAVGCVSGGFAIDTSLIYHYAITAAGGGGATTPEPGTLGLLGAGLAGLGMVRRRRNQAI